jgi:hypothetical protein
MSKAKSTIALWLLAACLAASGAIADGYFGYDQQGAATYTFGPSYCWGNRYSGDFLTPSVSVTVDTFVIWCNGQNNNPKVIFGIYDVIGGVITNKVGISDTLYVTGNTMQRWTCPANTRLASGVTFTICVDISGAAGPAVGCVDQTAALSRSNNSTFPKTWSDNTQINYRCSLAAHYRDNVSFGARRRHLIGGNK